MFGASLDALDLPEKVALKSAYARSLRDNRSERDTIDPYGAIKTYLLKEEAVCPNVEWIGRFPIESWLSSRPDLEDAEFLRESVFTKFLDSNGCLKYSNSLESYLKSQVYPSIPLMIGVDHSLTGGVLRYISELQSDFNVMVFDSHTDLVDFRTKYLSLTFSNAPAPYASPDIYECGGFIGYLLNENVIEPERVWILGTQELPGIANDPPCTLYEQKIHTWVERGVHLISKWDLLRYGIPEEIKGPTYISFDMDLGSCSSVLACRFLDREGLNYDNFMTVLQFLAERIKDRRISLLGLDVMEIDVHFLGAVISGKRDLTLEIVKKIFDTLVSCTQ